MASLIVVDGPAKGQKFALASHRLVMVGRDASASFQIIDPELSRHHLQIKFVEADAKHYAVDFNTKNGVYINDKRISEETPLSDGTAIRIGHSVLVYTTDDSQGAEDVRATWKLYGQGHINTMTHDD